MNQNLAEVRWTDDYEQFKKINYNRDLLDSRVAKLVKSINKYGYLLPILIDQDYQVIDGQHRLEAARKSGKKISYIQFKFDTEMLPILIATVNSTSKNWSLDDYLNMWVDIGRDDYVYMSNIMDENDLTINSFLRISSISELDKYKSGDIKFTENQKVRLNERLNRLNEIRNINESYAIFNKSKSFTTAVINCITHPDYNHDRMITLLEESPGSLMPCYNSTEYVSILQTIYNRGLKKNRIKFGNITT